MNKKNKTSGLSLAIIPILALFLAMLWLYTGQFNPLKKKIFAQIRLPLALVGNNLIFWPEIFQRIKTSNALTAYDSAQVSQQTLYNRTLDSAVLRQIARAYGIQPDIAGINAEFASLALQNHLAPETLEKQLKTQYDIEKSDFLRLVLEPLWLKQQLQIWYSANPDLNGNNFKLAKEILLQLKSGTDFDQLAQKYSQDESSRALGGNLPTLEISELLPEIQKQLKEQGQAEARIVPSRLGLHIIKILFRQTQGEQNQIKLQQIFLDNRAYAAWYAKQTQKIRVIKIRSMR